MVKHWCAVKGDSSVQVSGGQQNSLTLAGSWYHGIPGWNHYGNLAVLLSATGIVYWFKIWMIWIPLFLEEMWQYLCSIINKLMGRSWTWAGSEENGLVLPIFWRHGLSLPWAPSWKEPLYVLLSAGTLYVGYSCFQLSASLLLTFWFYFTLLLRSTPV